MPAPDRVEQIIVRALIASRLGALAILALTASFEASRTLKVPPFAGLCLFAVAASVAAPAAVASRRAWRRWVGVDLGCLTALVTVPVVPALRLGAADRSPFFVFVMVAIAGVGLADLPLLTLILGASVVGLATLTAALVPGSSYPLSDAVLDAVTPVAIVLVVSLVARSLRTSAAALHLQHEAAVRRTSQLAMARERARQQAVLGGELRSTLAALAADRAVADPGLHAQVRSEARWLETVVRLGLPDSPRALVAALWELVADKRSIGMSVTLSAPAIEPPVDEAAVAAVVEACREALTNVAKHSGTSSAAVEVTTGGLGVAVEIRDSGRGFDVGTTAEGIGHARSIRERVTAAGGRVDIDSVPGRGTAVRLWVPTAAPDGEPP